MVIPPVMRNACPIPRLDLTVSKLSGANPYFRFTAIVYLGDSPGESENRWNTFGAFGLIVPLATLFLISFRTEVELTRRQTSSNDITPPSNNSRSRASIVIMPSCLQVSMMVRVWCVFPSRMCVETALFLMRSSTDNTRPRPSARGINCCAKTAIRENASCILI